MIKKIIQYKLIQFALVIIISIVSDFYFLEILEEFGYLAWLIHICRENLILLINTLTFTLNPSFFIITILKDILGICSIIIIFHITLSWFPTGLMTIFGIDKQQLKH